ncbi:Methionine aminopeptidase 1 [Seminavis robusta]|uniref:Methionine aminopeptidase n=1 Tax=Seminavis robusta TaxID=568900 RepID=A0A9N8DDF3_9STRA|nr:Methionine aminopeptidase 1 [Seminavis robusta]|eukprot:Sro91_g047680.1 Methionine aminopeptidase 1 (442) ;mRNA; f:51324-52858
MSPRFLWLLAVTTTTCAAFQLPTTSTQLRQPQQQHGRHHDAAPLSMIRKSKKGSSKSKKRTSSGGGFGSSSSTSTATAATGTTTAGSPPAWASRFPFAGTVRPGAQTPQKIVVDESIVKPDYALDGRPKNARPMLPWVIEVKTEAEIEKMRAAGRLARKALDLAGRAVKPGVTTQEIDEIVHQCTIDAGAYPSPLNYHGFPCSCCTSVNEVICHGIPDDRPLQEGDIINLDITVYLNGFHGDCSEMFYVGNEADADDATKNLLQTTYDCWIKACNFVQPGNDYKDIGAIIEDHVEERGFTTVRNFCGHGIGSVFHTNPNILHYRNNEPNGRMAHGHTFTIEPMICEGSAKPLSWPDDWTATTVDGRRSAQFEHTLLVTSDGGVEALTGKTADSPLHFWERESEIHRGAWLGTSPAAKARMEEINAELLKQEEEPQPQQEQQ